MLCIFIICILNIIFLHIYKNIYILYTLFYIYIYIYTHQMWLSKKYYMYISDIILSSYILNIIHV